jgi:hypothetical protein
MNDLLPKMIVQKKPKEPEILEPIPKEKIEQNQVFEDKTIKKKNKKVVIIQDDEPSNVKDIEDEIKELENEIEEAESNEEEEPEQHPHFDEPIQEQEPPQPTPVIQPIKEEKPQVKIDKRKGKPSQARLEHLARIREKAAETRRKKADEKNKQKENPTPQQIQQPIYNHNITPEQISFAINHALEIQEQKRMARKEQKKKKKEEEAILLKKQKEEEEVIKKVMKAVNIPRQGEWDFCFR